MIDRGDVGEQIVYNLNVGDSHTYVVDADGRDVVVHNASCPLSGVYALVHKESGKVYRIGQTNNLVKRMGKHKAKFPELDFKVLHHSRDYATRRGLEEMEHLRYSPLLDKQRAIQLKNKRINEYRKAARDFMKRGRRDK